MDQIGLCQPASAILLVSVAGVLYHILAGDMGSVAWWAVTGIAGTGVFQGLCYGGIEPVAWVLMMIPVLIVCFFLAVALFASRMRIENVVEVPCDRCGHRKPGCRCHERKPRCNKTRCGGCPGGCPYYQPEGFANPPANCLCGCGQAPGACEPARCRMRCAVNA
jgi:hypothetical protein